jgi:hypothetical protein
MNMKRKRSLDEPDDDQQVNGKRGKVLEARTEDGPVVLEDSGNGAILIDDD